MQIVIVIHKPGRLPELPGLELAEELHDRNINHHII